MKSTPAFWKNKKVLLTGGAGFLGRVVVRKLKELGCEQITIPRQADYDLVKMEDVKKVFSDTKPDIVINLAAVCGGIGANRARPGEFFYKNLMIGTQMMEVARLNKTDKFVAIGTICGYPKIIPVPFKEENLWDGYPEETNAPYGLAKKMQLVQSQSYRNQYGFNSIYVLPVNLYGPGDNFDLESSHVIPALIRKFMEARDKGDKTVPCWGTGRPTREFLYVDDCAEALLLAAEYFNESEPVNIGSGKEISIKALSEMIKDKVGYKGELVWDATKPDGQPKRMLDTNLAKKYFGFEAKTSLSEGLDKTIAWYESQRVQVKQ